MESANSIGEAINIGSNYEVSIGETAEMIADIMGVDLTIETDEQRLRPEKVKSNAFGLRTKRRRNYLVGSHYMEVKKASVEVLKRQ